MPEIIKTTVYRLDELPNTAKEKARAWYREGGFDHDWYEFVYADFETICSVLGLHLKTRPIRLMGGGTRQKPCIYFSGFWSQGDGACFEAYYAYNRNAPRLIRDHAPQDTELHRIADSLQVVQRCNFYQLRAEARHRGHYYHEYCMAISVERDSPTWQDMTADAEDTLIEALRDLAGQRPRCRHITRMDRSPGAETVAGGFAKGRHSSSATQRQCLSRASALDRNNADPSAAN